MLTRITPGIPGATPPSDGATVHSSAFTGSSLYFLWTSSFCSFDKDPRKGEWCRAPPPGGAGTRGLCGELVGGPRRRALCSGHVPCSLGCPYFQLLQVESGNRCAVWEGSQMLTTNRLAQGTRWQTELLPAVHILTASRAGCCSVSFGLWRYPLRNPYPFHLGGVAFTENRSPSCLPTCSLLEV